LIVEKSYTLQTDVEAKKFKWELFGVGYGIWGKGVGAKTNWSN
jgi:hypothetical protein